MNKKQYKLANQVSRVAEVESLNWMDRTLLAHSQAGRDALIAEMIGVDTADQVLDRQRDFAGRISNIENSPETYGQSIGEQQKHYGQTFRMVTGGKDCDCEIEDTDRALVAIATHNQEGSGRSVVELE